MTLELRRRSFTVEEYHRMAETGVLAGKDRLELIHGEILMMTPIGPRHAYYVSRLTQILVPIVGEHGLVWAQNPVQVEAQSEPQPDIVIVRPRGRDYLRQLPVNSDVLLAIEVADSSLEYDRDVKLPLYASAGIPESWILDVNQVRIERHTEPAADGYRKRELLGSKDAVTLLMLPQCRINLADILGE